MSIRTLLTGSAVYIVSSVITSALPFLLLPILTEYMSPEEFSLLGIFQGIYTLFLAICGLSVGGAIIRKRYDSDVETIGVYIFNALLIWLTTVSSLLFVLLLAGGPIAAWLGFSPDMLFYALAAAAGIFVFNILLGQYQVDQRPVSYGCFQVSQSFVNVGLSLFLVIAIGMGAQGRILGIVVAGVLFGSLALFVLRRQGRLVAQVSRPDIREALAFGVPLIPHGLGTFLISWVGILVLNKMLPAQEVGVYLLAFQVSMILGIVCDAVNKAVVPWLFGILKSGDPLAFRQVVRHSYVYFAILGVLVLVAFVLADPVIAAVFDESYRGAAALIGWLVLGQAFGGCYLVVTNYIIYARKTAYLSMITVTGGALNFLLLFLLVPDHGVFGAVIAFIAARLAIFLMTWFIAHRVYPMPWKLQRYR